MASIGSKREWEVSEMEEGVCVHGIPLTVSPVKESRSTKGVFYFDARVSDGKRCVRVVSFDATHQPVLKKAAEEKSTVAMDNCNVKESSLTSELEVQLHKRSKVNLSPRKLSLGEQDVESVLSKTVKISDLLSVRVNQVIRVVCKVVKVGEVMSVKKGGTDGKELRKQDVTVGDESGSCRLVLWEEDVNVLEEGKSYCLMDVGVRKYGVAKYLSYGSKSSNEEVGDLGTDMRRVLWMKKVRDMGKW